ncbi:MAG: MgtC/SapB family protein, partial [Bauldia sp.]
MDEYETLTRLGLALAIGLLIGVERGWREREEAEGERAAGLRTFALIGLFGGLWGLLSKELGAQALGLVFLAFAVAATVFRWRETEREGTFGMTTLIAAFLAFSLGVYAAVGDMTVAAAAGVAAVVLLAAKEWLHAWLKVITYAELRATLILLAMSFIALPILPDRGYGPYDAINPHGLWLMTIAIAGVSFIGYVAVK